MFAALTAFAITSAARLLTGARALWLGSTAQATQRLYYANHSSHGDFVLLWASLPAGLRKRTRPVAGADYWQKPGVRSFLINNVFNGVLISRERKEDGSNPLQPMLDALDGGDSLIIFPEGTRNLSDEPLLPFKSGLFHLAQAKPEVELVPVWIANLKPGDAQGQGAALAAAVHAELRRSAGTYRRGGQGRVPGTCAQRPAGPGTRGGLRWIAIRCCCSPVSEPSCCSPAWSASCSSSRGRQTQPGHRQPQRADQRLVGHGAGHRHRLPVRQQRRDPAVLLRVVLRATRIHDLAPTRRSDYPALVAAFYFALPMQYLLIALGWYGLFAIFIPVYLFLLLPILASLGGDTTRYLERAAKVQWGLMIAVYCISAVPALLTLQIPGYEGRNLLLIAWLIIVVQLSDVLQYVCGKLLGKHKIAPNLSPSKTVEGFVGGVALATLIGASLCWITPFAFWQAALFALLVCLLGFAGGLVMSAIKRDRGVKDWGHMIEGHGGMLDRLDSVCFAAPVFFHMVRYWWA